MSHQLTEKTGNLLPLEGLLTPAQLTKSTVIQKQQDSTPAIGKLCVSAILKRTDLDKVSVKHRGRLPLGELLLDLGLLTASQVQTCLEQQKKSNPYKNWAQC